ncbi:RrF2 family transcriptional regulator [Pelagibius sp.]|uniref:RrF2 family transcriptional regulator n=1 Tax=Pelagibius sp. TaxID=1931238 RepID=UPI003BAFCF39
MKRDSRLSGILHLLLHMAEAEGPLTSEALGRLMRTNPVVIRRTLSGLKEQGIVGSERGHGGGWTLERNLSAVTLGDVYRALGHPALFAIGNRNETPGCLLEQAVNAALDDALKEAEEILVASFDRVSLATLEADFRERLDRGPQSKSRKENHAG